MMRHAYMKMLATYGYKFSKPSIGQLTTESIYVHEGKHVYDTLTIKRHRNGKHSISFVLQSKETECHAIDVEHVNEAMYMLKARKLVSTKLEEIFKDKDSVYF